MRPRSGSTSVSLRFSGAEKRRCGRRGSQPGASGVHDLPGCAGQGGHRAYATSILVERLARCEPGCARLRLRTGARIIGHKVDRAKANVRLTRSGRFRSTATISARLPDRLSLFAFSGFDLREALQLGRCPRALRRRAAARYCDRINKSRLFAPPNGVGNCARCFPTSARSGCRLGRR